MLRVSCQPCDPSSRPIISDPLSLLVPSLRATTRDDWPRRRPRLSQTRVSSCDCVRTKRMRCWPRSKTVWARSPKPATSYSRPRLKLPARISLNHHQYLRRHLRRFEFNGSFYSLRFRLLSLSSLSADWPSGTSFINATIWVVVPLPNHDAEPLRGHLSAPSERWTKRCYGTIMMHNFFL